MPKPSKVNLKKLLSLAVSSSLVANVLRKLVELSRHLRNSFASDSNAKKATAEATGALAAPDGYQTTTSTNAKDLCTRYCSQLGLKSQQFVKISQGLAEKVSTVGDLAGRSPLSVAAACIYMASALLGKPKSAKEISQVAGVSDGTIRTAYKYLYADREKLIEPEWIADGKGKMDNLPVS
ncbi:hypothetical protein EYC84_010442 [Monilinia fructicola]|uniref:Transcription initiation factor IIB n=1 Tax=Monilinia fructicola TaxID=38448 RepID=A0A5M9JK37_MONFR|nr:hypothetical protein EYC84_010442 [Monilinia fructicola]